MSISLFLNSFFYNHIKLTSMRTFPQGSISSFVFLFCFLFLFWDKGGGGIGSYDLDILFYQFCGYYYRHDFKVDAIFFYYISGVLTEHMFENLHGFHSYEAAILCKNVALSLGQLNFYWFPKKLISATCHLVSSWKLRDLK